MTEITSLDVQSKIIKALEELGADNKLKNAVRTSKLAKRIKRSLKAETLVIQEHLCAIAGTPWARRYASFVGGTSDPLDQHEWALPAQ